MNITRYKKYLMAISFSICIVLSLSANEEKVDVDFTPATEAEREATKPSKISGQDVIDLLHFAGVPLTEEQIKNLRALPAEESEKFIQLTEEQQEKIINLTEEQKQNLLEMTTEEKIRFLGLTPLQKRKLLRETERDIKLTQAITQAHNRRFLGTAIHQVKGFHLEALVFYAAMGASMAATAQIDFIDKGGRTDPRWMETLIYEMTSTVGLFSFFAFVIASGQMNTFYSRWLTSNIIFRSIPGGRQTPKRVRQSLGHQRLSALNNSPTRLARVAGEVGTQSGAILFGGWNRGLFFANPLGMATGMMASNIVHEVDFIFTQNAHFPGCKNKIFGKSELEDQASETEIKQEDLQNKFHCDLFYEELGHTINSWMPGLVSLVAASMLSHALVNMAYSGIATAGRGVGMRQKQIIKTGMLRGVTIRASRSLPLGAIARGASWLVPVPPVLRGGQLLAGGARTIARWMDNHIIRPVDQWVTKHILPGGRGHSFVNLFTFMLTDTWVTHGIFADWMTEPETAKDVAKGMKDFMKYHNVDYTTNADEDFLEIGGRSYHESIVSAHKLGLSFSRWRQFRTQHAMMAYQNWFKYVSETIGSFEEAYDTYKKFFMDPKTQNSNWKTSDFFGIVTEEEAKPALKQMWETIDQYIVDNNLTEPEDLNLHVVSSSHTRFLKPQEDLYAQERETKEQRNENVSFLGRVLNGITGRLRESKEVDRIFTLRALLNSVNEGSSIEHFYGDEWDQVLKAKIDEITFASEQKETPRIDTITLASEQKEKIEEIKNQINSSSISNDDKLQMIVGNFSELLPVISQLHFHVNPTVSEADEQNQEANILLDIFMSALEQAGIPESDAQNDRIVTDKVDDWSPFYFERVIDLLDEKAERFSSSANILDDTAEIETRAREQLRKKIQASAVEYLKWIIEKQTEERSTGSMPYLVENPDNINLPLEALSLFRKLGENNIFAKLYAKTFIKNEENGTGENTEGDSQYKQINPQTPGMQYITDMNDYIKEKEKRFDIDIHPDHLAQLRTLGIMDFFIASALCGPDLRKNENTDLFQKLNSIFDASGGVSETTFEETFSEQEIDDFMQQSPVFDRGLLGKNYNFYPPLITTIDEQARRNICAGVYSQNEHRVVTDIYNGHFPVGDKVYNNLLYLVLDHIGLEGVSSQEEFKKWWYDKMELHYISFILSADKEYQKLVKNEFTGALFHEGTEEVNLLSEIISVDSGQSVSDQIFKLTKEWIENEGAYEYTPHYSSGLDRAGQADYNTYSLPLDKGVFKNIHFEALYWGDIILHYIQKTENPLPESDLEELKKSLKAFAEGFNPETEILVETEEDIVTAIHFPNIDSDSRQKSHIGSHFAKNFLANVENLKLLLVSGLGEYHNISEILNIDTGDILSVADPVLSDDTQHLSDKRLKEMDREAIGAFSCDSNKNMDDCERVSLPKQILNYSIIKLNRILTEATSYANIIGYISEHPEVSCATASLENQKTCKETATLEQTTAGPLN